MKKIGDTCSFKNFYENNRIYIDKTEYLYRMLVDNPLERIFVSRPRRFGKSLTLDTVATLFESGSILTLKVPGFMINGQSLLIQYLD